MTEPAARDPVIPHGPVIPRDPVRLLFSRYPWVSAGYLLSYLVVGTALFVVSVTVVATAGALSITMAGIPLLVIAALLVRACADVERGRLLILLPAGVSPPYRPVHEPGLIAAVRQRWSDPATRRDLSYLIGLYVPFMVVDAVVVGLWLSFLGGVTAPLWYWSIPQTFPDGSTAHGLNWGYFPHGPQGPGGWGVFVGDPGTAFIAAGVSLILFAATNHLLVRTAFTQARIARALLSAGVDPMAEAKRVLSEPGPLRP